MADITTGAKIVSTQVAKKHPASAPKVAESAASDAPKFAKDVTSIGEKAKDLAGKGIEYAKENPGKTALAAGAIIGAGVVIAKHDAIAATAEKAANAVEAKGKEVLNSVADHPIRTAAVVGAATYIASKHGEDIKQALTPASIEKKVGEAEHYAQENPIKAGLMATALTYVGIKTVSHAAGHAEGGANAATFKTIKELTDNTSSAWTNRWTNLPKTEGAIDQIQTLAQSLADAGDPLGKQVAAMAVHRGGEVSDNGAMMYVAQNDVTLKAIKTLLENSGY